MAWNRSERKITETNHRNKTSNPRIHYIVSCLVFVAIVAISIYMMGGGDSSPKSVHGRLTKSIRTNEYHKAATNVKKSAVEINDRTNSFLVQKDFPYTDGRKVVSSKTNEFNQIIDICIMPNGRSRKVIRKNKPPVFKHSTDQLIAFVLSGSNDDALPPIPIGDGLEEVFHESLSTPIVINPDDSDIVKETKKQVIEAREFIDEELRKGVPFKKIIEEHLATRKANAELRDEAMSSVWELMKTGDADLVNEYVGKVNGLLKEHGVGEISVPDNRRTRALLKRSQKQQ